MPRYVVAFFFDYQSYTCADKNKPMFYCFFVTGAWFIGHLLLRRTIQGPVHWASSILNHFRFLDTFFLSLHFV